MSNLSVREGYSRKSKEMANKGFLSDFSRNNSPGMGVKLPPLNPEDLRIRRKINRSKNRAELARSSLDYIIEDVNKEYESAICKHLNFRIDSIDTEVDDGLSPLVKITIKTPKKFEYKYSSKSVTDHYSRLSQVNSVEDERKEERKLEREKQVQLNGIFRTPKAKVAKISGNIEEIRLLLNKIKHK